MFKTHMGPVQEDASVVYLRPETAQGSYVNFKNVQQSSRKKLPFGIAQIGKAFRNEISPGNFVFRMREFEQMEMQYFVRPAEAAAAFEEWLPRRFVVQRYGVTPSRLRFREHAPDELAHYAKKAIDVEYRFPFGWKELEGIHNRGDFDLSRHQEASGREPRVLRPRDRGALHPVDHRDGRRAPTVPRSRSSSTPTARRRSAARSGSSLGAAPGSRAVQGCGPAAAEEAARDRRAVPQASGPTSRRHTMAVYDDTAAIGKLYRRQDEIGTPWCVTVDVESLEDGAVTVRDRDSMTQERVPSKA